MTELERLTGNGARVAFTDARHISHDPAFQISAVVEVFVVLIGFIGTDNQVGSTGGGVVHHQDHFALIQPDGGSVPRHGTDGADLIIRCELDFVQAQQIFQFTFIDFKVAADQHEDQFLPFGIGVEHRLAGLIRFHAEEVCHFFNGLLSGRRHFFHGQFIGCVLFKLEAGDRHFPVRLVALAVRGEENAVFAAVCQRHKFVGDAAAHHAGVGEDGDHIFQAHAAIDLFVCGVCAFVIFIQRFLTGMEAVSVLHGKFADPDQTGSGAGFVTIFCLDLIDHDRQLFVAVDFSTDQLHHSFFVGHAEEHCLIVTVFEAEQFFAHAFIAAGFLPEFCGQDHGHQDFLTINGVHLFPDDLFDLADNTFCHRKQRVDPGRNGADVTAADQNLVAVCFCIFGVFAQALADHLGHSHFHDVLLFLLFQ